MDFQRSEKNIFMAAYGFYGGFIPILRIGQYLRKRGYNVVVAMANCNVFKGKQIAPDLHIIGVQDQFQQIRKPGWKGNALAMFANNWKRLLPQLFQKYSPHLVIADFGNLSTFELARKLNIPTIANIPESMNTLRMFRFPDLKNTFELGGLTVLYSTREAFEVSSYCYQNELACNQYQYGLCFVNTFFGFDDAMILPPNVKLTGPLLEEIAPFDSKSVSNELNAWLHEVEQQNLDIIYVTMGTIVFLSQPFINKLYESLKRTGKAVLWSLKTGEIPQKNPKFFVEKWLPQSELLKLASVKVVISHCGFGAVMEAIHNQKPILALPAFNDQHVNATKVEQRKIGLILRKRQNQSICSFNVWVDDPNWTDQQFQQKINKLLTSHEIRQNVKQLNSLAKQAGGFSTIEQCVYNAIKNGISHLIDHNIPEFRKRSRQDTVKLIKTIEEADVLPEFRNELLKNL